MTGVNPVRPWWRPCGDRAETEVDCKTAVETIWRPGRDRGRPCRTVWWRPGGDQAETGADPVRPDEGLYPAGLGGGLDPVRPYGEVSDRVEPGWNPGGSFR